MLNRGSNYSINVFDIDSAELIASINVPAANGAPLPHALLSNCDEVYAPTGPRWLAFVSQMHVGPPAVIEFHEVSTYRKRLLYRCIC